MENDVDLKRDYNKLKFEHDVLQNKFSLVSAILASKKVCNKTTEQLDKFHNLLMHDFVEGFAEKEDTMTSDATAFTKLQGVEKELTDIVNFPMLSTKNIVAVAGGFSSGKSKFLNTVIEGGEVKLSVGINPVTAIPTFLISGENPGITAYTPAGMQGEVPVELFNKIDHKFIEELGFNLKTIMPYVTVTAPFTDKLPEVDNLCIIDTPGYDPAKNELTEEDCDVTFDVLQFASSIMWFIDIDNGTLHKKDVDFLHKLNQDKPRKLYIVVSKADRKESSIQAVIDQIKSDLEDNDISYEGISAFSANKNKEYFDEYGNTSLYNFLLEQNKNVIDTAKHIRELTGRVDEVFQKYHDSIANDLAEIAERKEKIRTLQFNYEKSLDQKDQQILNAERNSQGNYYKNRKNRVNNQWNSVSSNDKDDDVEDVNFMELTIDDNARISRDESNDKEAYRICLAMNKCIEAIFAELNPESLKKAKYKKFCEKCGTKLTGEFKFCPKCGASTGIKEENIL